MSALPAAPAHRTPRDVHGWVRWFQQREIPILEDGANEMADQTIAKAQRSAFTTVGSPVNLGVLSIKTGTGEFA